MVCLLCRSFEYAHKCDYIDVGGGSHLFGRAKELWVRENASLPENACSSCSFRLIGYLMYHV